MKVRRRVPALDMIKSENVKVKVSRRVPALDFVKSEQVKVKSESEQESSIIIYCKQSESGK